MYMFTTADFHKSSCVKSETAHLYTMTTKTLLTFFGQMASWSVSVIQTLPYLHVHNQ